MTSFFSDFCKHIGEDWWDLTHLRDKCYRCCWDFIRIVPPQFLVYTKVSVFHLIKMKVFIQMYLHLVWCWFITLKAHNHTCRCLALICVVLLWSVLNWAHCVGAFQHFSFIYKLGESLRGFQGLTLILIVIYTYVHSCILCYQPVPKSKNSSF